MTREPQSLSAEQCWALLARSSLGRLAISTDEGADIYPVNFLVDESTIVFRSAPGSKMIELATHPLVAFEVDGRRGFARWSVVVRGRAQRMDMDSDIKRSGVLTLRTATTAEKHNYVRITPDTISGRRV